MKKGKFVPGDFDIRVQRSRTGRGMFAHSPIPRGACIIEYKGRPTTTEQKKKNEGKYLFWTGRYTMIDGNIAGNAARFINHSCKPNCEVDLYKRRIYIFAKRAIKVGEELTYDYDTEYFDEHIKPRGCLCQKCSPQR